MTCLPLSWVSFNHLEATRITKSRSIPWDLLTSWLFPNAPTSSALSSPGRVITTGEFFDTNISTLRPLSSHYQPLDFFSFLNLASTATPKKPIKYWALVWSPTRSSPILVRLSSYSSLCPNYSIEHWVLSPTNQALRNFFGKNATNYDFFIPCSSPGCLDHAQSNSIINSHSGYSGCLWIGSQPLSAAYKFHQNTFIILTWPRILSEVISRRNVYLLTLPHILFAISRVFLVHNFKINICFGFTDSTLQQCHFTNFTFHGTKLFKFLYFGLSHGWFSN